MPTYRNLSPHDVVVGDFIAKGGSTFTLGRYLSKSELNKYIEFVSDEPIVSPILNSFANAAFNSQLTITLSTDNVSSLYKLKLTIYCNGKIKVFFNSTDETKTKPAYLGTGTYVFDNIPSNIVSKIILVNDNGASTSDIRGYISYC